MPSRAVYTALAAARSETGCSTVLIPWVEEPLMVTPVVVGHIDPVCLVESRGQAAARHPCRAPNAPRVPPRSPAETGAAGVRQNVMHVEADGGPRDLGSGGRGPDAGRSASQQRRDWRAAVHLGAHGGDPRVVAAA